jgi:hypothetical protein
MSQSQSKPSQYANPGERILLRSLSWDHSTRSDKERVRNALSFWAGLHGTGVRPNVCFVPAHDKTPWSAASVDGIEIRPTSTQLEGQILLALVELPTEPTNEEQP